MRRKKQASPAEPVSAPVQTEQAPAPVKKEKIKKEKPAKKEKVVKAPKEPKVKLTVSDIKLPTGVKTEQTKNYLNLCWDADKRKMGISGSRVSLTVHHASYGPNFVEIKEEVAKAKHYGATRSTGKVKDLKDLQRIVDIFFKK